MLFSFPFYLYRHCYWLVEYEPGILSFILLSIHHLYLLACFVHCSSELKYHNLQVGQLSSAVCYHMPSLLGNDTRIQRVPHIRCRICNQMTPYKFPVILGVTSMDNEFFNRKWFQSGIRSPFSVSPVMHTSLVIINPRLC